MQQIGTKQNILLKAGELFYAQGFNNTGMEKITEVCGIKKPALYYHFGSKNDLGLAYLDSRAEGLFAMLNRLLARSDSFGDYLADWASALMLLARRQEFFGCPFTAFASELDGDERKFFTPKLRAVEREWLAIQERAYRQYYPSGKSGGEIAQQILIAHTGCVMLYRASRDMRYLKQLKSNFAGIARQAAA